jgi:uncharacterized protein (TIGR02145 family)
MKLFAAILTWAFTHMAFAQSYNADVNTFFNENRNYIILDIGVLNLYQITSLWVDEPHESDMLALSIFLNAVDDGVRVDVVYLVQFDGRVEQIRTGRHFREQVERWFTDDPELLSYIHSNGIKSHLAPYLVRMYNRSVPRVFEAGFVPLQAELQSQALIDERDGQRYDVIRLFEQEWMGENLRYPCVECGEDAFYHPDTDEMYYTWQAALDVCPPGWRLPTEVDWKVLFLGMGMPLERINRIFGFDRGKKIARMLQIDVENGGMGLRRKGHIGKNNELNGSDSGIRLWTADQYKKRSANTLYIDGHSMGILGSKTTHKLNVRCIKEYR